ncbi:MAG: formate dehydrogenase subunit alpha [Planctomycetota bacterium]|nr:formate dehydrogenase subunit alpha [Planctomycetota bacterium]
MPCVVIDGKTIEVSAGTTVLAAAQRLGVEIPTLCHHKDLIPVGSCRLCLVAVDGCAEPQAACTLPIADGMQVQTESAKLTDMRRQLLEMLLADFVDEQYAVAAGGETEFMRRVRAYDAQPPAEAPKVRYAVDSDPNPFVWVDMNKCILCTRCVRACQEVQGRFVWGVAQRGHESKIVAGQDTTMLDARCESCGACVAYCPTGALDDRMSMGRGAPDRLVRTTCGYCGVGCQFDLNVNDQQLVRVTSTENAGLNGMSLCVKGRYGFDFVHHQDRLLRPRVRQYLLDGVSPDERPEDRGPWVDVDWDMALDLVAKKIATIKQANDPNAIGLLSSAKCTNEENYLMQKFARQVVGTHNVDHCARLCHSSTLAGLAMAFGSGAMSNSMDDIVEQAQAIFIIGSNTTEQHPVFGAMIRQAVLTRSVPLVVADPRKIDVTEFAALHLRQRPGTDVALINGLMHLALANDWQDHAFIQQRCEGFEDLQSVLQKYTPELVGEITGVEPRQMREAAQILCGHRPLAVIWAMGITQHTTGVMNVLSLANLQMLLGNMGVPGGGVNPLRGQNNVQGACDMGALPNVFPGYQPVTDGDVLTKFQQAWALEPAADGGNQNSPLGLLSRPGLTVTEMVDAAGSGDMRALYILGEDPVMTEPDSNAVRQRLANAELVVLQEIFPSETSQYADVLLPGASFAEKSGTFTNTDRRVQPVRQAIQPLGDAQPDWKITADIARRILEIERREPVGPQAGWDYQNWSDILAELAALTPSYAGITARRVESGERLQWPVWDEQHAGTPVLHVGQFTRGKGKFHAVDHLPARELPDEHYPLLLTTGRVLYHWHGGELSRRSVGLLAACPDPVVEISPEDGARMNLVTGQGVHVRSRRGEMHAQAVITDRVSAGVIFGNFHFPGEQNVNNLTLAALDPVAKIPEYKVCAVALEADAVG